MLDTSRKHLTVECCMLDCAKETDGCFFACGLDRFSGYLLFFLIKSPRKYIVPLNWVRKTEYQNLLVGCFGHFLASCECGLVFRMFVFCPPTSCLN